MIGDDLDNDLDALERRYRGAAPYRLRSAATVLALIARVRAAEARAEANEVCAAAIADRDAWQSRAEALEWRRADDLDLMGRDIARIAAENVGLRARAERAEAVVAAASQWHYCASGNGGCPEQCGAEWEACYGCTGWLYRAVERHKTDAALDAAREVRE